MITLAPVALVLLAGWSLGCGLVGWWMRNARAELEQVEHRHQLEQLRAEVAGLQRELLEAEHGALSWPPADPDGPPPGLDRPDGEAGDDR